MELNPLIAGCRHGKFSRSQLFQIVRPLLKVKPDNRELNEFVVVAEELLKFTPGVSEYILRGIRAHLACAIEVVKECAKNETWTGDLWFKIRDKVLSQTGGTPEGFLRDLCDELGGLTGVPRLRRPEPGEHAVTIAPFALVRTGGQQDAGEGVVAQFRFERLEIWKDETASYRAYLAPEHSLWPMDDKFYESCFVHAVNAASEMWETHRAECLDGCDIRITMERFEPQLGKPPAGKFDRTRAAESPLDPNMPLMDSSASAAAAWGLYYAGSKRKPDRTMIVMAEVASISGRQAILKETPQYECKEVGGLLEKAREVARLAQDGAGFDTIAVVGAKNEEAAQKGLHDAGNGGIDVVRIDTLAAHDGAGNEAAGADAPTSLDNQLGKEAQHPAAILRAAGIRRSAKPDLKRITA